MWVAVDVMSGDFGPEPIIRGSIDAVNNFRSSVVLVGNEELIIETLLGLEYDSSRVSIVHAPDIITMDDSPAVSVRSMPESSIVQAIKLVANRECVGLFSPGNTGATMAAALLYLGRITGVLRPPIAAPIPQREGSPILLLDAGANVDCKPEFLAQFAIMGEVYVREIFGVKNPKIGILSNGEEDKKGCALSLKTFEILKKLSVNFVGNIEGRDLYGEGKEVDVVICDGFVGNIVLKATEGLAKSFFTLFKKNIEDSSLAKTGALLLKPTLEAMRKRLDYHEYGGAMLLGVNGICVIGHGSSDDLATMNAIRVATECARNDVNVRISENLIRHKI
ncbi:MAG: phosphate acyltransferase PlsX [Leptospiraceae bacterium]|nr:phosphate acyltransferase PlsX [Leptospiraceae bacterium]MCP5499119.1 phosphate acyltransferase PlsX [Leptospiraceae bacterium]